MKRLLSLVILITLSTSAFASDFYVSTNGSDENSGTSAFDAFRKINHAIAVADTSAGKPHMIHVGSGTWTRDQEPYPLSVPGGITLSGAGMGRTILDGYGVATNLLTIAGDTSITVEKLTIRNGSTPQGGGIIIGQSADAIILNQVEITKCEATVIPSKLAASSNGIGGGLLIVNATNITVQNCLFHGNSAENEGGAIAVVNASPYLTNLTISDNSSDYYPESAALSATGTGTTTLTNSIIWGNPDFAGTTNTISGNVSLYYSIVENDGSVWTDSGHLWGDPLFEDADGNDFHLLEGSIGVDNGDPEGDYSDEPAPNGGVINLGAYGGTSEATISGANYTLDRNGLYFIGVPVQPASMTPADVFGDEFGTNAGESTWQVYSAAPDEGWLTYIYDGNISPGNGFIIQQKQASRITINADGYALNQDETVVKSPDLIVLDLDDTFTFAANPFPYPIHLQHTSIQGNSFIDAGYSVWGLVMQTNGRFTPTYGILQPWQGVLLIGFGSGGEWWVPADRTTNALYSPLESLDWVLQIDFQTNADADTMVRDNGHLFGLGSNHLNGIDEYDAVSYSLIDTVFLAESEGQQYSLYHDFKARDRTTAAIWRWKITGYDNLPDSIDVEFTGIDTTEGSEYPNLEYGLYASEGNLPDTEDPEVQFDLREQFSFRIPFPANGEGLREAWVTVWADSTGWQWNDVAESGASTLPAHFAISRVYPNPFNPSTTVTVALPKRAPLKLKVYDILGREVMTLANGAFQAGSHRFSFDGKGLASGVYFVRATSNGISDVRKIVLMR